MASSTSASTKTATTVTNLLPPQSPPPASSSSSSSSLSPQSNTTTAAAAAATTTMAAPQYREPTLFQNVIAGAIAGIIGQSVIFPFYTAKTRLQSDPKNFRTVPGTLRRIFLMEGIRGIYKGLPAALTGVAPEKAIKLSANDYFRHKLSQTNSNDGGRGDTNRNHLGLGRSILAGGLAGFCQVIATCPMEMSMITLQTRAAAGLNKMGLLQVGKYLGLSGLYKGTMATLFRDVPFSMIFFSMNATLKDWMKQKQKKEEHLGITKVFLAGIIAGTIAATLSTPMDVVKTKLQASETVKQQQQALKVGLHTGSTTSTQSKISSGSLIQYRGIGHCILHTAKTEGLRGFMNGAIPRVLIISPLFGIALLSYEVQKRLISSGSL